MAGNNPYDSLPESDFRTSEFTRMGMSLELDHTYTTPVVHPGDVHDPIEFGYDITNPDDKEAWDRITGEVSIISDYTVQEAQLIQDLVSKGHAREVAVQTVLYERLG